jgi:cytochrome b subunit of formate dehydrogenase
MPTEQPEPVESSLEPALAGRRRPSLLATLVLSFLAWGPTSARAQDSEDCFLCHEDADLTGERGGQEIPLFVDQAAFGESVHGGLDCIDCHVDLVGSDLPHEDELGFVDCTSCHDDATAALAGSVHRNLQGPGGSPSCSSCHGSHEIRSPDESPPNCAACHPLQGRQHARSLHGVAQSHGDELAPGCVDCHGGHDVRAAEAPDSPTAIMNVPLLCGRCHREGSPVSLNRDISQDHILQNYSMSIHGEGLFRRGLTVTAVCTSCHTSHLILPASDPNSSIHHDNVARTCAKCHAQIESVHRQVIEGRLWEEEPHKIPACVDCHSPHEIRRVFYPEGTANADCMRCHEDPELTMERDGATVSLFVDMQVYSASSHADTACAQCHTQVTTGTTERACETITAPVDCSICHAAQVTEYQGSIHGTLFAEGDPDAPSCQHCHEKHATTAKNLPSSRTFSRNVPVLCAECHRVGERAAVRIHSDVVDIVQSYVDSTHGKGLMESGLVVTATCADCHGAHGELPPSDPQSSVNPKHVPETCGKCHLGILEIFKTSVHWSGKAENGVELPTCESCHTSHTIGRIDREGFRFEMMAHCGNCHRTEAETFFDTFHGKVSRLGSAGAAKCYDCHGTHGILPASDPRSTLGRDNVVQTCGQCHPDSNRRFAGYLTHATHHDQEKYPLLFWTFWGMTTLLVGTLTFALLHTLAWLFRLWLSRDEWRAHKARSKVDKQKLYQRFSRYNRFLHLFMMLSFLTLALTGMTLKFSYAAWAQGLAWILGGFETTGALHRLGAATLVVVFFVHLNKVRRDKRRDGKSWWQVITGPSSILFNLRDLKEAGQSVKWFLGLGPRPHYGRYTYWEKFDYFAVLWGIIIIGSTGLVLWFPEFFTRILPGWTINVATIIHSDEALLAVGFIFTIHFFNTHFRPDKFPMDPVIFTGRTTVEELKYDKPREYEALVESGQLEEHLVEPVPHRLERLYKIFGFCALGLGLSLVVLIIYAMIFSYR